MLNKVKKIPIVILYIIMIFYFGNIVFVTPLNWFNDNQFKKLPTQEQNLKIFSNICSEIKKNYYDQSFNGKDWNNICANPTNDIKIAKNNEDLEYAIAEGLSKIGMPKYAITILPSNVFLENHTTNQASYGYKNKEQFKDATYVTGIEYISTNLKNMPDYYQVITDVKPNSNAAKTNIEPGWMLYWDKMFKENNDIMYNGGYITPVNYNEYIMADAVSREKLLQTPTIKVKFQERSFPIRQKYELKDIGNNILYVKITDFDEYFLNQKIELMNIKHKFSGIIFDLRHGFSYNYDKNKSGMGGLLNYIMPNNTPLYYVKSAKNQKLTSSLSLIHFDGKICIITGAATQDDAEIVASAIKTNKRGLVIGETTNGSALRKKQFDLIGGGWIYIPIAAYLDANKNPIEGVGVTPDIIVHPTIEAIKQGHDEILERAVQEISKN